MIGIRAIATNDLEALHQLAVEAGIGMTTLTKDRELLKQKIENSVNSFKKDVQIPGGELYWFVMEDTESKRIIGSAAIYAAIGLSRPFYSFRVTNLTHTSQELEKYEPVRALQMVEEYRGCAEIATLFLTPEYRKNSNGKFLSRSRFLFLAEFAQRFPDQVIAEMRGVQDDEGHSAFWDNLGRHFIKMSFSKADYLSSLGKYQFIADLMPKYPVYIRLLPEAAREVIGVVNESTKPALALLRREGFRFEGCVDVFDAGPTIVCPLSDIETVKNSQSARIEKISAESPNLKFMISNCKLDNHRMTRGAVKALDNGSIELDQQTANYLDVSAGESVRYATI
ncbi:MAG: arginine N-succinyltransferase [Gammaproteobacteria bacterium]|nr:arginine N-succinyltransferase [Gammaproteobacteria bacterium]